MVLFCLLPPCFDFICSCSTFILLPLQFSFYYPFYSVLPISVFPSSFPPFSFLSFFVFLSNSLSLSLSSTLCHLLLSISPSLCLFQSFPIYISFPNCFSVNFFRQCPFVNSPLQICFSRSSFLFSLLCFFLLACLFINVTLPILPSLYLHSQFLTLFVCFLIP